VRADTTAADCVSSQPHRPPFPLAPKAFTHEYSRSIGRRPGFYSDTDASLPLLGQYQHDVLLCSTITEPMMSLCCSMQGCFKAKRVSIVDANSRHEEIMMDGGWSWR
jgi:hypothetical protein